MFLQTKRKKGFWESVLEQQKHG